LTEALGANQSVIISSVQTLEEKSMVTKKTGKKKGEKERIKTINLKRESIKDLSRKEKKKVKGGGGAAGGVVQGRVVG